MNLWKAVWNTKPKSNRLAYYWFVAERASRRKGADIGRDVVVEYKGSRFLIPKNFVEVFYDIYIDDVEPITCKLMMSLTGDVFVDIGANVGGYTIRLAKSFKQIVSIEPNPKAADVLRINAKLNSLSNVDVIQVAVSDTIGLTAMNVPSSGKTTRSSIVEEYNKGTSFEVRTSTLDDLLERYPRIDLIKIDAEGAEVRILKAAEKTLQKTSRIVLETGSWSERETMEILQRNGFEISNLDLKVSEGKNVLAVKR